MKPLDLVNKSARRVNIIAHNETLSDSEAMDALDNLNSILSMWSMRPLIAKSGLVFPLEQNDMHTGLDDQFEYGLIDILAVRLAGVYGLPVPQDVALSALQAEKLLERQNISPLFDRGDTVVNLMS